MSQHTWTSVQKILFRVAFIFFLLLVIPISKEWYTHLAEIKGPGDLFSHLAGYRTNYLYFPNDSGRWGLLSFIGAWVPALVAGIIGGAIWTLLDRNHPERNHDKLYYWLRIILRYRLAFGLIVFGYLKVVPMQMPYPSVESLNTQIGDYSPYKIYWQQVGVVQWYEIVLGWLEVIVGTLFFFRQTTAVAALATIGVLSNISYANMAYDGGVHVYSGYFVLVSLFLLVPYARPLYDLLIRHRDTGLRLYYPAVFAGMRGVILRALNYAFILLFLVVTGYNRWYTHYRLQRHKEPVAAGLPGAQGYYDVTEFRLNGREIPYSPVDTVRWQHVVFEKYSTLVYQVNRPAHVDNTNGGGGVGDISRNYELSGIAGGKRFFYYEQDTVKQTLTLQDKNTPRSYFDMYTRNFGSPLFSLASEDRKKDKKTAPPGKLFWHYSRPSPSRIILSGVDDRKDSIYVVLDKADRHYALEAN